MAKGNLRACLDEVWPFEGGYVDHPKDPGGATNMGITLNTLMLWRGRSVTKAEVKALTKAEAEDIYAQSYLRPLNGEALRRGDDLVVLDFGINSGVSRSANIARRSPELPRMAKSARSPCQRSRISRAGISSSGFARGACRSSSPSLSGTPLVGVGRGASPIWRPRGWRGFRASRSSIRTPRKLPAHRTGRAAQPAA